MACRLAGLPEVTIHGSVPKLKVLKIERTVDDVNPA